MGGDFNEVLKARDKFGGNPIKPNRSNLFWNCVNSCQLVDLGFKGSKYTWSNKRYKNRSCLILERIDRCFANNHWVHEYPEASITHLARTYSDHCPLLVKLNNNTHLASTNPFRFESMWCNHPMFQTLIRDSFPPHSTLIPSTTRFKENVTSWNKTTFGNILHKKKTLLARIAGIQKSPSYQTSIFLQNLKTSLIEELDSVLKNEEDFWKLKVRINWLSDGNANIRFFHTSTLNRRRRNGILYLKGESRHWHYEPQEIKDSITNFFQKLYSTYITQSQRKTTTQSPRDPPFMKSKNPLWQCPSEIVKSRMPSSHSSLSKLQALMAYTLSSTRNTGTLWERM
ncbi:PREDICTED: uncharacterized protein LOC109230077 [Nicotiana attenuata]|uniref:uncharacterized protein LOC109230077 n=1 Tax=Nicotiana attenuata TaxID=49451 RepID=UPI0009059A3D|nr:PREDICTED: uncharacterized protein LOC109230077 [Nicotiana attenuata]